MNRVLILGGGFGGIACATALRQRLDDADEIVLVERRPTFVMGLRKNWAIVGASSLTEGERPLAALETRGIRVRQGSVTAIRPADRAAEVDGDRIVADALVVALGAERDPDRVPGFREHALDVFDRDRSEEIRERLDAFTGGRVLIGVFGVPHPCPPAPYELAFLITDGLQRRLASGFGVLVFSPQPRSIPVLGPTGCDAFEARLADAGISFRPNTTVTTVEADAVDAGGVRIPFDLLLGIPPHRLPSVVAESGLANGGPWVRVDPATLETGHDGVWAIGDVTVIPMANGNPMPKAGVFAHAEGEVVAARIADRLAGRVPSATFDGVGMCYLETGGGSATMVQGHFMADPPDVTLAETSAANLAAKHAFERDRLIAWFGG